MRNGFISHHFGRDEQPDGGLSYGCGFSIAWQRGEPGGQPNGAFVEDIIDAAADRLNYLKHYQKTGTISRYIQAVNLLEEAIKLIEMTNPSQPIDLAKQPKELTLNVSVTDTEVFEDVLNIALKLYNTLELYEQPNYDDGSAAQKARIEASALFEEILNPSEPEEEIPAQRTVAQPKSNPPTFDDFQ